MAVAWGMWNRLGVLSRDDVWCLGVLLSPQILLNLNLRSRSDVESETAVLYDEESTKRRVAWGLQH